MLVGILLARFLGSENYGSLVFLMATSMVIKQFLDLGSSSAFFTFLSQETKSIKFVVQFWLFFFTKYILAILIILFVLPGAWLSKVWLGNSATVVVIALMAIAFQSDFWSIASQLLESQRKTIRVQMLFVIAQLIHFGIIFGFHYFEILTIINYLIAIGLLWFIVGLIAVVSYDPVEHPVNSPNKLISIADYIKYCAPIAPIVVLNFTGEFLDKWMLQNWGGPKEQAYFAISVQIASITLLITASFIKIFWKEVAEALHKGDAQLALSMYTGARKAIYYCAAFIAAAGIPWASEILNLLYGSNYMIAAIPLILLLVYSIHQSIGQIDSAFLMASGKTRLGFKVSSFLALLGPLLSYCLISNSSDTLIGLNLGAIGLGMKMVVAQLLSVNAIAFLIQKEFGLKLPSVYQIQVFTVLIALGFLIKAFLILIFPNLTWIYLLGIFLYCLVTLLMASKCPKVIALPTNWMSVIRSRLFNGSGNRV